jgi:hypothetical protein
MWSNGGGGLFTSPPTCQTSTGQTVWQVVRRDGEGNGGREVDGRRVIFMGPLDGSDPSSGGNVRSLEI